MGVDNWFFGNAVSVPTKAHDRKNPRPLLCPEERLAMLRNG
jgi:hypothetical protein